MPPAASVLPSVLLAVLTAAFPVSAAPHILVDEDFSSADDSLWHFQTAAFTEGVLSPGLAVDVRSRVPATGQLRVDPGASALRFLPREGAKAHRSCFLGYRSDFRMEDVYASKVEVEVRGEVANPAAGDSLGGLFILVRYENEVGNAGLARTRSDIRYPGTVLLDTAGLVPIGRTDWFGLAPLEGGRLAHARSHIIGLGLCYISQKASDFRSRPLLVGGFRARGELSWPRIPGSPEDSEIMAGDSVALSFRFPPALAAEFDWYRNEKPIAAARGPRFVFRPGPDDARVHVFRAEVRLRNGDRAATLPLRVKVLRPAPPAIVRQTGDTAVPVGGNAFFRVSASGLQPLAYQWYKEAKAIAGATGPTYILVPSSVADGGRYHCEVKDKQGRMAKTRSVSLIVKPGPDEEAGLPQGLAFGAKVGLNISDFHRDPQGSAPGDRKVHFLQAGMGGVWQFRPAWALQADLLFSRKGVAYRFEDHTSTYDLDYLELPLLIRARPGKWMSKRPVSLIAGGYGALLVNAAAENDWGSWKGTEVIEGFQALDYGAVAGMSLQLGMLTVEWRYSLGLAPLDEGPWDAGRMNGVFSAMIGLTLFTALEGPR